MGHSEPHASRRSFVADAVRVLRSNMVVLVLSLVSGVIVARVLGPEGKGTLAAIFVVPQLFVSIAELGIRQSATYQIGSARAVVDRVVRSVVTLFLASSGLGILISIIAFKVGQGLALPWIVIAVAALIIPVRLATSYTAGVLLGVEQISVFARIREAPEILRVGVIVALAIVGLLTVESALVAAVLAGALTAGYAAYVLGKYGPLKPSWDPTLLLQMLHHGGVYAVSLFSIQLMFRLDVLLMTWWSTPTELGHYSVGVAIAEQLWQVPTALGVVVFSRSAATRNRARHTKSIGRLVRLTVPVSVAAGLLAAALAGWVVPLIYGSAYAESAVAVRLLIPGVVAFCIFKILNTDLAGRGRPGLTLAVMALVLPVNLALNWLWIPSYGSKGAASAATVSYAIAAVLLALVYCRVTGMTVQELTVVRWNDIEYLRGKLMPARMQATPESS